MELFLKVIEFNIFDKMTSEIDLNTVACKSLDAIFVSINSFRRIFKL